MNYYSEWKKFKPMLGLLVALIFWSASVIFFIIGMSFDTELIFFGVNIITYVAIALAAANTIIQVGGNDDESMDTLERVIWLSSYALGIGTNIYGLLIVFNMKNQLLEAIVAVALGIIIEVSPEKQLVKFLKSIRKANGEKDVRNEFPKNGNGQKYTPKYKPANLRQEPTYHNLQGVKNPPIMSGKDFFGRNK